MLTPRRVLAGAAAAAVAWPGLALGVAPSAGAADLRPVCATASVPEHAKMARAVFTGTVQDVAEAEAPSDAPAGSTAYVSRLDVDRVYKPGGVTLLSTETVDVRTEQLPGRCSLGPLEVGERYVVFAGLAQGELVATGESGTAPAEEELVADVEQVLGDGRAPVTPAPPVATFFAADTTEPVPFARAALPGAALTLLSLLALVAVRHRGRRT